MGSAESLGIYATTYNQCVQGGVTLVFSTHMSKTIKILQRREIDILMSRQHTHPTKVCSYLYSALLH